MIISASLQEKNGPERMRWAPQSHSQQAAPREQRSAPADGGSTAASEWQPCRCAKRYGESPWWCACAPPGQGSPSWPSWPLKSSTPPSHSPGLPPPGTASSSPSITSATCARTQRDRRPDRDSGEAAPTCNQRVTNNATEAHCVTHQVGRYAKTTHHRANGPWLGGLQWRTTLHEKAGIKPNLKMMRNTKPGVSVSPQVSWLHDWLMRRKVIKYRLVLRSMSLQLKDTQKIRVAGKKHA